MEVVKGILKVSNTKDHIFAYVRNINNLNLSILRFASKFIDIIDRKVDTEAQQLLSNLRDVKVPNKLESTNIVRYNIEWLGKEGLCSKTHEEYLKIFCENFYKSLTNLISRKMKQQGKLSQNKLFGEILQHLHACNNSVKIFLGREEELENIKQYITNDANHPMILYGPAGCGKTSLLSKSASLVTEWLIHKPILILRFLGTSPDSSAITPLLTSIVNQIILNYNLPKNDIPTDINRLIPYFKKIIECAYEEKPLIICLDSVDFLSTADGSHDMIWLPVNLPKHVKIVLSLLETMNGILGTLQRFLANDEKYFLVVKPLGQELSLKIISKMLDKANRCITVKQWEIVKRVLNKCSLAIFVQLVFYEICRWKSYSRYAEAKLEYAVNDSIIKLFDRIELQHGKILVFHSLAYITASKNGLSESELEDLISLDDIVLDDVYQYHLPPVRRIPPLLWTRIRNDLPNYLVEIEADGTTVLNWYHRQFVEAARERYFRNVNTLKLFHSNIAEYFLGIWGEGKPKPFKYTEIQIQRFGLIEKESKADRKVPGQPLAYFSKDDSHLHFNLRKLSELPFHLIRSDRLEDFYHCILFNYDWLYSKLSSYPLQALVGDIHDCMAHFGETFPKDMTRQITLLVDALRLSNAMVCQMPDILGIHLMGRLLPIIGTYAELDSLLMQCDTIGIKYCSLVATHHFLHTPGGPLQFSMETHQFAVFGIKLASDNKHLYSISNRFIVFNLQTGDAVRNIFPGIEGIMQKLSLSPDDRYCVTYTNLDIIIILNNLTGDVNKFQGPDNIKGINATDTTFVVWSDRTYCIFSFQGTLINKNDRKEGYKILFLHYFSQEDNDIVLWKGESEDTGFKLESCRDGKKIESLSFHYAIIMNKFRTEVYACVPEDDKFIICMFKQEQSKWKSKKIIEMDLANETIINLKISPDEKYILATLFKGFRIWNLGTNKQHMLLLPEDVNNIPILPMHSSPVIFTKENQYIAAGVRAYLYVWDLLQGLLINILDVHFGRIFDLIPLTVDGYNCIISSSLDRSIKVWNMNNILEESYIIDRQEKRIESISVGIKIDLAVTVTRTKIGIWNIQTGKLVSTLSAHKYGSIITHAIVSQTAEFIITSESDQFIIWNLEKEIIVFREEHLNIQQLFLTPFESNVIVVSKLNNSSYNNAICILRSIPRGEKLYEINFTYKLFRDVVVNSTGDILIIPKYDKVKMKEYIGLYDAKNGVYIKKIISKSTMTKDFIRIVAIPKFSNQFAFIDKDKGSIYDIKRQKIIQSIPQWNGLSSLNGKLGIKASDRGLLELISLRNGSTKHILIPNLNEGIIFFTVMFSQTCEHIFYYHQNLKTLRIFRISDGKQIANYMSQVELSAFIGSSNGKSIIMGGVDGSIVTFTIVDLDDLASIEYFKNTQSRKNIVDQIDARKNNSNQSLGYRTTLQSTLAIAKMKTRSTKRLHQSALICVIS